MTQYTVQVAGAADEFEQIHRLNYEAFVEEIPQHPPNAERRLTDRFHKENTYIIGKLRNEVVAMLALRSRRPFSLDEKLPDLNAFLPDGRRFCEFRLLYIVPEHRGRTLLVQLLRNAMEYACGMECDAALISGTLRQEHLYEHIGFRPFGPAVGTGAAVFQPMLLLKENVNIPWKGPRISPLCRLR